MPDLNTPLHLDMLKGYREGREHESQDQSPMGRLKRMIGIRRPLPPIYGLHWGDPEADPTLKAFRDRFLTPYVDSERTAVEIGPGGGRWTQYLVGFKRLYAVDYHGELLEELARNFKKPNVVFVKNHGTDFPDVPDASVDFLFSFGTFVHLDANLIDSYLTNMRRILAPDSCAVIQYSDQTKTDAQENPGFSDNDPTRMRALVEAHGYQVVEEDLTSLNHSAAMRFTL